MQPVGSCIVTYTSMIISRTVDELGNSVKLAGSAGIYIQIEVAREKRHRSRATANMVIGRSCNVAHR